MGVKLGGGLHCNSLKIVGVPLNLWSGVVSDQSSRFISQLAKLSHSTVAGQQMYRQTNT